MAQIRFLLFIFLLGIGVQPALAHVKLLHPKGGEQFQSGTSVKIDWEILITHNTNNWDLYISMDNGTTWSVLKENINKDELFYNWTVPSVNSSTVKIKVVQDNQGTNYQDISGAFEIKGQSISGNEILMPALLKGPEYNLKLQTGQYEFFPGKMTATMGVNGPILGPTLWMKKGEEVDIKVKNDLGQRTTIHWHGMHVASVDDGGPHIVIQPGETWNPKFEVKNNASTCWYHPHLDKYTDQHVSKGIAGFIIIEDDEEAALNLPRTYGIDDIPLAVQTKAFNSKNEILYDVNSDKTLLVNGVTDAYVNVPAQVVRFRLLDGSSQRVFNFGLEGNKPFYLIATDGGLLDAPVSLTRLPLSPGERGEILVDFSGMEGKTIALMSYAAELQSGIYGASQPGPSPRMQLDGYNPNPLNGTNFNVIRFVVGPKTQNAVQSIPNQLGGEAPLTTDNVSQQRAIDFMAKTPGPDQLNGDFYINGVSFDLNTINITTDLNAKEIWTVTNNTPIAHPFHVHGVSYDILDVNGVAPPPYARGKKDTYLVPGRHGSMRIIMEFKDFANDSIPYMYHCHMLKHEDGGMMGSYVVVDKTLANSNLSGEERGVVFFPNPTRSTYVTVATRNSKERIQAYSVMDKSGRILTYHTIDPNEISNSYSISVIDYVSGTYQVRIYTDKGIYNRSIVVVR